MTLGRSMPRNGFDTIRHPHNARGLADAEAASLRA